ncbi:hypothetical protein GCM10018952_74380 [Streptosporangium vulgare]
MARVLPSRVNATELNPSRISALTQSLAASEIGFLVAGHVHKRTVPSSPPLARVLPSRVNATSRHNPRGGELALPSAGHVPQAHRPVFAAAGRVLPSRVNATEWNTALGVSAS